MAENDSARPRTRSSAKQTSQSSQRTPLGDLCPIVCCICGVCLEPKIQANTACACSQYCIGCLLDSYCECVRSDQPFRCSSCKQEILTYARCVPEVNGEEFWCTKPLPAVLDQERLLPPAFQQYHQDSNPEHPAANFNVVLSYHVPGDPHATIMSETLGTGEDILQPGEDLCPPLSASLLRASRSITRRARCA